MAQVDTSIYQNLLRPPKSVEDYRAEFNALDQQKTQNLIGQQQVQLGRQKADEYARAVAEDEAYRSAARGFGNDPEANASTLDRLGLPKQALSYREGQLKNQKTLADIDQSKATTAKTQGDVAADALGRYRGMLAYIDTPDGAARWLQAQYQDPVIGQHMQTLGSFDQAVQSIPRDPAKFQQWREQAGLGMEHHQKLLLERRKQGESERHNKTTEGISAGQLKVSQGQLGVAQGNLGLSRERLTHEKAQPKGIVVQTDQGPVLADPRTGVSTPLTMGGTTLGPKLKDIPASANTAILTNSQNLTKVQQAIDLLEGKEVGVMKGDKNATGWKGFLPNTALNRMDTSGVDARAAIADLGSLIIHDRSGAAVTASESPRLMPFIPLVTDDVESAKKKLKRFKQIYEAEASGLAEQYGADSGYRKRGGGAPAAPPAGKFKYLGTE